VTEPLVITLTYRDTPEKPTADPEHIATCGEHVAITGSTRGPIGPLCRKMIEAGTPEDATVIVMRGDTLVFAEAPITFWSEASYTESPSSSVSRKKYTPFQPIGDDA
jgi:hypothetical protein